MLEVLAPCGNRETLNAAVYAGADAVYLGMGKFNARQKAENFNEVNINEVVEFCHLHNVKVYITFNTLLKDSEFCEFEKMVDICVKANVDAFIVTDLGTLDIFKKYDIPLHASTQMGIHNYEGAKVAKDLGFKRVVLSRETLIKDIEKIKTLGLEIEYFVHGALCVSFSGGCLMSSFMCGDSGNRGLCRQPCRLKYKSSFNKDDKYYLSTSDQCLIDKIFELEKAGVCSLKIEGRLKSPQYVGEVVKQYKLATLNKKDRDYMDKLKKAYNRGGFTKGYNFDNSNEIMSIDVQGNMGQNVGVIKGYKDKCLIIESKRGIFFNDGFKVLKDNKELGGFKVNKVEKINNLYYVNSIKSYPVGSHIYITLDSILESEYKALDNSLLIDLNYEIVEGENLKLYAKYKNIQVKMAFNFVQFAKNTKLDKQDIEKKLSELGETNFKVNKISGQISPNAFYPMSQLKAAKREIIEKLKIEILENYNKNKQKIKYENFDLKSNIFELNKPLIEIENLSNLPQNSAYFEIVLNMNECLQNKDYLLKNDLIYNNLETIWLKIPKICRYEDMLILKNFVKNNIEYIKGFLIENIYGIEFSNMYNKPYILGIGMNILNQYVPKNLNSNNYILSLECSLEDINTNSYVYLYGPLSLMTLSHCPVKINTGCNCNNCKYKDGLTYSLQDNSYKIKRVKIAHCYFDLLNFKSLDLLSQKINSKSYLNLSYLSKDEVEYVIKCFKNKESVSKKPYLGHLYLKIN